MKKTKPALISNVRDGKPRPDGNGIEFVMDLTTGDSFKLTLSPEETADFLQYIALVSAQAVELADTGSRSWKVGELSPIPVEQLGRNFSGDRSRFELIARCGYLDLTLAIPVLLLPELTKIVAEAEHDTIPNGPEPMQ